MAGNKLLLLIGSVAYIALLALQWLTYTSNVEFSILMSIALIVQALAGVPVVLYALGLFPVPIAAYSKALFALVAVLAVSGMVGVPQGAISMADARSDAITLKMTELTNELSNKEEVLDESLEIAEEHGDKDATDFAKEMQEATKKEKKPADFDKDDRKELRVLAAEKAIAEFNETGNRMRLVNSMPRNLLIVLAAFIILLGGHASADVFDALPKPEPKPKPAPAAEPPADAPEASDSADGDEEPTKAPE
ncbi:MAG: hypothetical protein AAF750_07100 [Planctomycetota bacterium]